jgi:hypothetical protein
MGKIRDIHRGMRILILSLIIAPSLPAENGLVLRAERLEGKQIQLSVTNVAKDVFCRVDSSSDFKYWTYLISSNSPGGFVFSQPVDPSTLARFYRAAETGEIIGQVAKLGRGTIRSWVRADTNGQPTSIGMTMTDAVLTNLPTADSSLVLQLPNIATNTPFKHIWVNWNYKGHPPITRYGVPHMDIHFYTITSVDRTKINLSDGGTKMYRAPATEFVPQDYELEANQGIAQMGAHWVDRSAPEVNGQKFTRTFLVGSYDGVFIFWEPMITLEFLKTRPVETHTLKLPQSYAVKGLYPLEYSISYSPDFQEYVIALDRFVQQ